MELGDRTHTVIAYAKGNLTKYAAQVMDIVYEQTSHGLDREVGEVPSEGRTIAVHPFANRLFLHVFARLCFGEEAARDEKWVCADDIFCDLYHVGWLTNNQFNLSVQHAGVAFGAALALAKYHSLVRPIAAQFIPEMRRLRHINRALEKKLRPLHQV